VCQFETVRPRVAGNNASYISLFMNPADRQQFLGKCFCAGKGKNQHGNVINCQRRAGMCCWDVISSERCLEPDNRAAISALTDVRLVAVDCVSGLSAAPLLPQC